MRTFGIDASHWEGVIDWSAAAPGLGFAYYKCTDGIKGIDDQFGNNQIGCRQAGLAHAPYHYFQPSLDPTDQADHFIHTAGKQYKKYILDVEEPLRDPGITEKIKTFLDRVEKLTATRPAIYTSAGYWNEYVRPKPAWAREFDLLIAHYTSEHSPTLPVGWNSWRIWQLSDFWHIPGCKSACDANWFNGTLEECREWFGNYEPPTTPTVPVETEFKVRSLFDQLHIRQAPNMRARITGFFSKGEIVPVEQLGGNDVWVRHARGWTVVERGGYRYMEVER